MLITFLKTFVKQTKMHQRIKRVNKDAQYINRELSWINFNKRVLAQAVDPRTPLLEQAKFSAIFSNNLDEFFMVRVASLKSQVDAGITKKSEDGQSPLEQLINIRKHLIPLLNQQQSHYNLQLLQKLSNKQIHLLKYKNLNNKQQLWVDDFFKKSIFPVLTPLAVDRSHPFPFISNLSLNIAVLIKDQQTKQKQFARVKVPQKTLCRFIEIPVEYSDQNPQPLHTFLPLEEVIAFNLELLFPGMRIEKHYIFRVTRDADLELRDIEADDLMIAIEEGLRKRRVGGEIVRLEVSKNMPEEIMDLLKEGMSVKDSDLYKIDGLLGLDDLFELHKLPVSSLKNDVYIGSTPKRLAKSQKGKVEEGSIKQEEFQDIFSVIRQKDILLHHPFDLFATSVEEFINQAADDESVMAIKITLYRTSRDSPIIKALIRAAENGKQVMALVELKARFDEDNNIQWARQLEQAGVHVVYGVIGLKTHTKIILVVRKEKSQLKSYVHIGTGNYNSKTSKLYTDLGLLSARPELGQDLVELFNYLTGFAKQQEFRMLLVAPMTLRTGIETLIKREIKVAQEGKKAHIRAKMNSLVDPNIIRLLYEASAAGVKIELIVRGMCCLYPDIKDVSENIKIISVIGQFLEHSRIFWFFNEGSPEVYIGSADLMRRNLDRRVEAITPIQDTESRERLEELLEIYLNDNREAWVMQSNGSYLQRQPNRNENCAQKQLIGLWHK